MSAGPATLPRGGAPASALGAGTDSRQRRSERRRRPEHAAQPGPRPDGARAVVALEARLEDRQAARREQRHADPLENPPAATSTSIRSRRRRAAARRRRDHHGAGAAPWTPPGQVSDGLKQQKRGRRPIRSARRYPGQWPAQQAATPDSDAAHRPMGEERASNDFRHGVFEPWGSCRATAPSHRPVDPSQPVGRPRCLRTARALA